MAEAEEEFGGIVLCSCGGKLIAINGKIMLTEDTYNLVCRDCQVEHDIDEVFRARRSNTKTIFYRNYGKPIE